MFFSYHMFTKTVLEFSPQPSWEPHDLAWFLTLEKEKAS